MHEEIWEIWLSMLLREIAIYDVINMKIGFQSEHKVPIIVNRSYLLNGALLSISAY